MMASEKMNHLPLRSRWAMSLSSMVDSLVVVISGGLSRYINISM